MLLSTVFEGSTHHVLAWVVVIWRNHAHVNQTLVDVVNIARAELLPSAVLARRNSITPVDETALPTAH